MSSKKEWDSDKKVAFYYLIYAAVVFAAIIGIILYAYKLEAKELGSYGKSYSVVEADIEQEIMRKLSVHKESGELERFQKDYQKEVARQIKSPHRVIGISEALEDRTREFDPTTYLEEDIMMPQGTIEQARKNPESIKYEVAYKAGTAINPLEYMKFNEPLIFVDGNNEEQLQYARDYQDKNQLAKIILIDGKPGFKEVEGREYHYFFDQWGAYSQRFKIAKVPSVVYQKEGAKVLTISEINLNNKKGKSNDK